MLSIWQADTVNSAAKTNDSSIDDAYEQSLLYGEHTWASRWGGSIRSCLGDPIGKPVQTSDTLEWSLLGTSTVRMPTRLTNQFPADEASVTEAVGVRRL